MENCDICGIISGKKDGIHNKAHIVDMKDGWVLNHCDSPNAYLGYLVLSTKAHLTGWDKLSSDNLKALGLNIQWIDSNLRDYWNKKFPQDRIEQIYYAYFNDGAYILQFQGKEKEPFNSLHVHIHILPRTKEMMKICNGEMVAWDLLKTVKRLPSDYLCDKSLRFTLIDSLKERALTQLL